MNADNTRFCPDTINDLEPAWLNSNYISVKSKYNNNNNNSKMGLNAMTYLKRNIKRRLVHEQRQIQSCLVAET